MWHRHEDKIKIAVSTLMERDMNFPLYIGDSLMHSDHRIIKDRMEIYDSLLVFISE